jgi:6-pyruvoyltetrahydropterin/6-carboxytetrahydropterin synthase
MIVYRTFRFHAARHLPKLSENHICKQTHGHTFNLTVYVEGEINDNDGFIIDFYDIDKIVTKSILSIIDHKLLNDIDNLTNPTSEYLCKLIWEKLENQLSGLVKIKLSEDHGTGIIYNGE